MTSLPDTRAGDARQSTTLQTCNDGGAEHRSVQDLSGMQPDAITQELIFIDDRISEIVSWLRDHNSGLIRRPGKWIFDAANKKHDLEKRQKQLRSELKRRAIANGPSSIHEKLEKTSEKSIKQERLLIEAKSAKERRAIESQKLRIAEMNIVAERSNDRRFRQAAARILSSEQYMIIVKAAKNDDIDMKDR